MRLTGIRGKKGGYKLPFISNEVVAPPALAAARFAQGAAPPQC